MMDPARTRTEGIDDRAEGERLVEQGSAFMELIGRGRVKQEAALPAGDRPYDVVVIGGGQSGLAVGYHLARTGLRFVILDAAERIGDAWRHRWHSLKLFTPAKFDALPGMPFPGPPNAFPTKDEMADYLEAYAEHFDLPVRSGVRVERLDRRGGRYIVTAGGVEIEAAQVIVAMAKYQRPRIPEFASELRDDIVQLHSRDYRDPSQLREGDVLVVGAGNSGAEIGKELSNEHKVWMAGRDVGQIPFRIGGFLGRLFLVRLVLRFLFHRVLSIRTPLGRKVRPKVLHVGGPLIRVKATDLAAAGVERLPKIAGVRDGLPVTEDGRTIEPANVVWCTGFSRAFSFIDLPVLDEHGEPLHEGGVVPTEPGLYFVGLHFQYSLSSGMIHGMERDAARIAREVVARSKRAAENAGDPNGIEGVAVGA